MYLIVMEQPDEDWEKRLAEAWAAIDDFEPDAFLASINGLAAELPPAMSAIADFERAGAFDSTGHSDLAAPLYRHALAMGLTGERRRRAVIQMSSSLRNLGDAPVAVRLLTEELSLGEDALSGAVRGFLALALADVGREREATALALEALSGYLPRYNRSLKRYAMDLAARHS